MAIPLAGIPRNRRRRCVKKGKRCGGLCCVAGSTVAVEPGPAGRAGWTPIVVTPLRGVTTMQAETRNDRPLYRPSRRSIRLLVPVS